MAADGDAVETFGALVRRRREALRLTRGELAARVACSEATIKKIELGERRPSAQVAALLAERLLVPAPEREAFRLAARGELAPRPGALAYPPPPAEPAPAPAETFVARERELAELRAQLDEALARRGRAVFVTGSAGAGKSALVRAFARESLARHPELAAAWGASTAYMGIGDPYLPFREQLDMLTGEAAAPHEAGGLGPEAARRLWELLPLASGALLDEGPDLVGTLRSAQGLAARLARALEAGAPVAAQLARAQARAARPPAPLHQLDLFSQLARALHAVAERRPLLLVADDLQWADEGSLALLFHLGRRIAGRRILLVGLFRPLEDSPEGARHPLGPVVNELQRLHGTRVVDLGEADRRGFLDALLDSEPNRLGPAFRAALERQTAGHALFTVEALRDMRERGALVRGAGGAWEEGPAPALASPPARAEGVIRERLARLPAGLLRVLAAASVEGESFTAEVVAEAAGMDAGEVAEALAGPLAARHHLVDPEPAREAGGRRLARFRFRHNLFQAYLYAAAGPAERARLHGAVGAALERIYAESPGAVAPQLARHYLAAGSPPDAVRALALAAGGALRLFALGEALRSLDQAVALAEADPAAAGPGGLAGLREQRGRARAEAGEFAGAVDDLRAALAGYPAGDGRRRGALAALGMTYRRLDDYAAARACLAEALALARGAGDQRGAADILYHLGTVAWSAGDNAEASAVHEEAVAICRREGLGGLAAAQALHGLGEALLAQGRPLDGAARFAESLALAREAGDRAYEVENLMMLGFCAAGFAGVGRYAEALARYDEGLAIARAAQLEWHAGYLLAGRGEVRGRAGDYRGGVADLEEALSLRLSDGTARYQTMASDLLGDLLAELGEHARALALRERALAQELAAGRQYWLPRLQANLALARLAAGLSADADAVARALAGARARRQGFHATRCLEALAAIALAEGRHDEALQWAGELAAAARDGGMAEHAAAAALLAGRALAGLGRAAEAEAELRRAAAGAAAVGRPRLEADARAALADACEAGGLADEAASQREAARSALARVQHPAPSSRSSHTPTGGRP